MDWTTSSGDEIDRGLAHFGGLKAAAESELCRLIQAADRSQMWMTDGARSLSEWVAVRLRVRFSTAKRLVAVARRLESLPHLSACFSAGDLSLDQVEAVSKMATSDTEVSKVGEAVRLSNHEPDRQTSHANPPSSETGRDVWLRRRLVRQWNLDSSELRFWGNLPGEAGEAFDTAVQDGWRSSRSTRRPAFSTP